MDTILRTYICPSVSSYESFICRFRTCLESHLCQQVYQIPLILIVAGGGAGTIKTIAESVERDIPVVLIKPSKGMAEKLAYPKEIKRG